MSAFTKQISLRWSDMDPNFHMRHSVYYDLGSQQRVEILEQFGLTLKAMQQGGFGPILFREECVFRKEIRLSDTITISCEMSKMRTDASRWSIRHEFRNQNEELCATLTLDGAWMDTNLRKIANPTPVLALEAFNKMPKAADFELMD
jgi:acyl-CoA thioester hydrolase